MTAYPALVDAQSSVSVRVLATDAEQRHAMWDGTRRLLVLTSAVQTRNVVRQLNAKRTLSLALSSSASMDSVAVDCVTAAVEHLMIEHGAPVWDEAGWERLRRAVHRDLPATLDQVTAAVGRALALANAVRARIEDLRAPAFADAVADVSAQLDRLVGPRFIVNAGVDRLRDLPRYLQAIERRLDKLAGGLAADALKAAPIVRLQREYEALLESLPAARLTADVARIRWMIEELRVSVFAQQLGTPQPISEARVRKVLDAVR